LSVITDGLGVESLKEMHRHHLMTCASPFLVQIPL